MKKLFAVLFPIITILAIVNLQAQNPVGPGASVAWDYTDSDLASSGVVRFEICYDAQVGSNCTNVTPAASKYNNGAGPGASSYKVTIPTTTIAGTHTINLKACNQSFCSSAVPFTFTWAITPVPIRNVRIIP